LNDYKIDTARFPKDAIEYATIEGKLYSSPPSFFDYATIYYNKEIFQKHNLAVPKNWAEFEAINKKLVENGVTPIAFGGKGDFDRYWLIQVFGSSLFNDVLTGLKEGKADVDYTAMAEGFDAYRSFAENGYLGKDYTATDGAGAQLAFTNGKTAMIVDGTWNNPVYEKTSLDVGRFALPGKDGKKYAQSGPSNFNTYAVSAKTEHPKEAAEYVRFLTTLEAQQIFEDANGNVPILSDIKPKDESTEEMAAFDEIGLNIYHVLSGVSTETSKPQDLLLTDILPKLMTLKLTGQEAADRIKEEIAKK
jgi:raffinose/stachyose/melibiose transport system substrate-binding protein